MESGGGVRLHVGGLGESVGKDDLLKIFSPMGTVDSVEFVRTKGRSFAYIDFSPSSTNSLTKLFSTYNGCVWKGGRLRLEKAKEHYLARLKREWEEESSSPASGETIQAPLDSSTTPTTHINIFFPRLRKVKAMPLSGTGKHKYSFQRVPVTSSLPKSFCDCEEHYKSVTPRETHVRDLEALNVGIDEEEVQIMNSVMNKLFQKNNLSNTQQVAVDEGSDEKVPVEEDSEIEEDQDNLIINVVSSGKDMRDSELDLLSRKRKSISGEATTVEEYAGGLKGNHIQPTKKRQAIVERQEPAAAIREKKKPSGKDMGKSGDEPSRTTGVKRSCDNVSWSQKSSWKSLMASGNSSNFSVSSFLPDVGSSEAVQPASRSSDLPGALENSTSVTTKIKRKKSKRLTSTLVTSELPVSDDIERNDSTATEAIGSDNSKALADTVTDAMVSNKSDRVEAEKNVVEDVNGNDKLSVDSDDNAAEDVSADKERSVLKDNVEHDMDREEEGKEPVQGCNKSAGGPSWLQKGSWTQLVSDKDSSFSITQLLPNLKTEVAKVNNIEEGQCSNTNQSEREMKQMDFTSSRGGFEAPRIQADSTRTRGLDENRQSLTGKNASEGRSRLAARKTIRRKIGTEETCTFMRSATSLQEWAKAKKALSEPRRKKQSEE